MEKMITDASPPGVSNSENIEPQPPGTATVSTTEPTDLLSEFSKFEAFNQATCSWKAYVERLQNHFELYDVPHDKQVRIIIDRIGNTTYECLRKLCEPDSPVTKTTEQLFAILARHFDPPTNKFKERVKFQRRVQRPQESLLEFGNELQKAAKGCEFPADWLPEALFTQFTHGIRNDALRMKLYDIEENMDEIDFDKIMEFAINIEPKLPPIPVKKEKPAVTNAPKPTKVANKAPASVPHKQNPTAAAKKRQQPFKMTKKNVKNQKPPFNNQYKPQFKKKNPTWQDYDDNYSGTQYNNQYSVDYPSTDSQYRNGYSNNNYSPRLISSTYKPNDMLFYRR